MAETKIRQSVLKDVWMELTFLRSRRLPESNARKVKWLLIEKQLKRLDKAIANGSEPEVRSTLASVLKKLEDKRIVLRTIIGSETEDKTRPLPPPVLEYLNHIVSRLELELDPRDIQGKLPLDRQKSLVPPGDKTC